MVMITARQLNLGYPIGFFSIGLGHNNIRNFRSQRPNASPLHHAVGGSRRPHAATGGCGSSLPQWAVFSARSKFSTHDGGQQQQQRQQNQEQLTNSTIMKPWETRRTDKTTAEAAEAPIGKGLPSVFLKRSRQSKGFRNGNQLVFSKSIHRIENNAGFGKRVAMGDLVQVKVVGEKEQQPILLGWGVYNPDSLYRVRILCHRFLMHNEQYQKIVDCIDNVVDDEEGKTVLENILNYQFSKALQTRRAMQLIPGNQASNISKNLDVDTFRLLNGEGDQVSGLAVDVVGGRMAVVMSSAAWCQIHKQTILACLASILPTEMEFIWKTTPARLKQDGFTEGNRVAVVNSGSMTDKMVLSVENGIKYATFPFKDGQKTGVYCDQRENRLMLATYCRDKLVLDLCCYHGGFSLNAIVHGSARHVTGVDSSQEAIDTCWKNAQLNQIENNKIDFHRSEIATFLQKREKQEEDDKYYDVVVLDPPKLAPSADALEKATRKYHAFNRDALKLINPLEGGLLLTCTCSAAMTQKDGGQFFLNMVHNAALAANRDVTLLRVSGAASCHTQSPISWPANAYLTAALFRVHATR